MKALAARRKARVQRKRAQGAAGNKNPFKEADVGYDQEQEVPGDFCEHQGRSTPWDNRIHWAAVLPAPEQILARPATKGFAFLAVGGIGWEGFVTAARNRPGCLENGENQRIESLTLFELGSGSDIFGSIWQLFKRRESYRLLLLIHSSVIWYGCSLNLQQTQRRGQGSTDWRSCNTGNVGWAHAGVGDDGIGTDHPGEACIRTPTVLLKHVPSYSLIWDSEIFSCWHVSLNK